MSQPGLIYRLTWVTSPVERPGISVSSKTITVDILDTENQIPDEDDPDIISLTPAGNPLTISVVDNNENKFTPVKGKQAIIRFLSNSALNQDFSTFADSSDKRWLVKASCAEGMIFTGFLMLKDINQEFLPDPVVVELTASDMLGSLGEIELVDTDGSDLVGVFKLGKLIACCLYQTGLGLPIRVINNVRHGTGVYSPVELTTFVASGNQILAPSTKPFFYPGQSFVISGTSSNNGTFTVASVAVGIITIVVVNEAITDESNVAAVFTDSSTNGHLYDNIYIDAKTFEKSIGEAEDCRSALEKIVGNDCVLFQWKGSWWIYRLDEIDENLLYVALFDADGDFNSFETPINPTRSIGYDNHVCHADLGTIVRTDSQHKLAKLTYKYKSPAEIICNMDFSRGDVISAPDLSAPTGTGTYQLDCFTVRKTVGSVTSTAYITREFLYGTENNRYVVITPQAGPATPFDFIESQPIELLQNDRGSVSVDFRWANDITGSGFYSYFLMKIYLHGDDGNWYYWWSTDDLLDPDTYRWTSSATETDRAIASNFNMGDVDETKWQTVSAEFGAIPVSGKLYIGLYQGRQAGDPSDNQNIYYQGLKISLQKFINGSYQLFTGQYHRVTRLAPGNYSAKVDNEVFISDSPRKEFKGAMFWLDGGGVYRLAERFYSSNVSALGPPSSQDSVHKFGYLQAFSVWNQVRLASRIFPSALYGLFREAVPDEWPDLLNKYQLTDSNPNTNQRYFLLISFEQDWRTCRWRGTFIEVYNRDIGHNYDDDHDFNFTTE